ncbi:MAG: 23S rRNA (pseudouridine(1915)-N(3))-methyltransferase RlmH [Solobacterium sp.]|nr:23S rRNA (pseudouridine(1915)-N(3))-methyltransferase RlmH [Solobacterium sp.]
MLKLICVGRVKDASLKALIDDYQKRIQKYHKLEITEVKDEPIRDNEKEVLDIEASRIMSKIDKDDYVILLDLHGEPLDSVSFAKKIDKLFVSCSKITFVIGGSLGLGEEVKKRANYRLKLSDMTFLHQMTRLIILEQIYRCFKILNHETYHK